MALNLSLLNSSGYPMMMPERLDVVDVYKTICGTLDHQVIVCIFLILTFYTVVKVIMPASLNGITSMNAAFESTFKPLFMWTVEVLENFSVLAIAYIIALLWMGDKLSGGFKVWAIVLISFVILAVVPNFVKWWRGGRKSGTLKDIKEFTRKLEDREV